MRDPRSAPERVRVAKRLPFLVLRDVVVFPEDVTSITATAPRDVRILATRSGSYARLACLYPMDVMAGETAGDTREKLHPVGVTARVVHRVDLPGGGVQAVLHGLSRFLQTSTPEPTSLTVLVGPLPPDGPPTEEDEARVVRCLALAAEAVSGSGAARVDVVGLMRLYAAEPGRLADLMGTHLGFSLLERRRIATTANPSERLHLAELTLAHRVGRRQLTAAVTQQARAAVERQEREEFLRAELREIQTQLGESDDASRDVEGLRRQVQEADMPEQARTAAQNEVDRLGRMSPLSADYHTARAYVGWLVDLPWNRRRGGAVDIAAAQKILDRDHYDMDEAKQRILEVLATLESSTAPPVLCLAGPPGTGKTSLGRALAEAAGRAFVRLSFAGLDDEAEIEGTRRNYVGAMPGRILQGIRRCDVRDPVFMIDDIDKMGRGGGADPASALVEAFDPETRDGFLDVYLDVPFDLSQVFFLVTANLIFDVPQPLRDRLEVVSLPGYTPQEKIEIARRHLVPKARRRSGTSFETPFTPEALHAIVTRYTREAGVRHLERLLLRTYRRLALWRVTGHAVPERITEESLQDLLGPPAYARDLIPRDPSIGIATGLAWTAEGGVIQLIEVLAMPGSGRILVTGRLGDVMRESADIAYSWVRAHTEDLGIKAQVRDVDLHVHAPEGGVRKDGPSSGVALATAMVSVLSRRPVRPEVAMTGELTLRGEVLAVGGIREKVSAAQRAGIHRVVLPAANRQDVEALTADLRTSIQFDFSDTIGPYLEAALM